jgi:hypothetical protein
MTTGIQDAELEVARTKLRFQQSLQLAGETGSRLATEIQRKLTPSLIVALVVGGVVLGGTAMVVARREPRRRRPHQPSVSGIVARAVGVWLLRAAALRLAQTLAAKFRDSTPAVLADQSEFP